MLARAKMLWRWNLPFNTTMTWLQNGPGLRGICPATLSAQLVKPTEPLTSAWRHAASSQRLAEHTNPWLLKPCEGKDMPETFGCHRLCSQAPKLHYVCLISGCHQRVSSLLAGFKAPLVVAGWNGMPPFGAGCASHFTALTRRFNVLDGMLMPARRPFGYWVSTSKSAPVSPTPRTR